MNGNYHKAEEKNYYWMTTPEDINVEIIPYIGRTYGLTLCEMQVLRHVANGLTLSRLSKICLRSIKTLSAQKRSAYSKIGISTDVELVHYIYWLHAQSFKLTNGC